MHRFLWQNVETDYIITAVNMGSRPSGTIASVALHKTTVKGEHIFQKDAEIILNSTHYL